MLSAQLKPTLGIYGPKFPERSGVAEYIQLTINYLSKWYDCTHVSNSCWQSPLKFDRVLYHLGNNKLHECAFSALRQRSGPILLHEFNNLDYYYSCWDTIELDEAKFVLGGLSDKFYFSFESLGDVETYFSKHLDKDLYSCDIGIEWLAIRDASTVLVHSKSVARFLMERYPLCSIQELPFPVEEIVATKCTRSLDLSRYELIFGCFGFIGEYKRIEKVLEAWEKWSNKPRGSLLLLVGQKQYELDIPVVDDIYHLGWIERREDFDELLRACDCGVQLRFPSLGETSASIVKFLAHNIPVITTELPHLEQIYGDVIAHYVKPDED